MTRLQSSIRQLRRSESGFTMIEMLVATIIMMVVTGAVFTLLNPTQGAFQKQPEVSDMQQRLRVGVDSLKKDLVMAGAGTYLGTGAGALYNFFAPVMPYRSGSLNSDVAKGVFYRPDTISIIYVPPTPAQTTIRTDMPQNSAELKVEAQLNCLGGKQNALCGFGDGMRVIIFDPNSWDTMTITQVQDSALHLQHNLDKLSASYSAGANITQVATHTYYLKTDKTTNTYQLMHYDGYQTDLPVVDNVVKLEFEYYGDPEPPRLLPNAVLSNTKVGPWTTYGPRPPALGTPATTTWPAGENCTFQIVNGGHVPRLPVLGAGGFSHVKLDPAILQDGPWCPDETKIDRYDADLLRIRRVRVNMRVQVAAASLRGPAGNGLFTYGGSALEGSRWVPDHEIRFDISPRNMNLGR